MNGINCYLYGSLTFYAIIGICSMVFMNTPMGAESKKGNELVDQQAKGATQGFQELQNSHKRYVRLAAAANGKFVARPRSSGRGRGRSRGPADQ